MNIQLVLISKHFNFQKHSTFTKSIPLHFIYVKECVENCMLFNFKSQAGTEMYYSIGILARWIESSDRKSKF